MPELPEVEVTRLGIRPHVLGQRILTAVIREPRLRLPVNADLVERVAGQGIHAVDRRGKYLLLALDSGALLIHLGMSGQLRVLPAATPPRRHDHVDLVLDSGACLRFHDPRRFGVLRWISEGEKHPLLRDLGPEPLGAAFTGALLHARSRGRSLAVKGFIMDAHTVVGVGNIYANEALFRAGIDPRRAAGRIGPVRYERLAAAIRAVLAEAIAEGGTTLRDFIQPDGKDGHFRLSLAVYGRADGSCQRCGGLIRSVRIGGRSSYFCPHCQH